MGMKYFGPLMNFGALPKFYKHNDYHMVNNYYFLLSNYCKSHVPYACHSFKRFTPTLTKGVRFLSYLYRN